MCGGVSFATPVILFLHNRYRVAGGEERAVEDLLWLAREHLGEEAELLARDSATLGRPRAAVALLRGGLQPDDVAAAVRRTGARAVSAHNLNPAFGWRALAAARGAGARVVVHLHNYRLVCAVGTCFNSRGEDCVRCQGRDTLPGVRLNCRGTGPEAAVYAASLALWQRRLAEQADAIVVPSRFAGERLRALRAPLDPARVHVVPHVMRAFAEGSRAAAGEHALVASRLAAEKGVDLAVQACARAGLPAGRGRRRPTGRRAARRRRGALRGARVGGRAGRSARPRRAGHRALPRRRDLRPGRGRGDGGRHPRRGHRARCAARTGRPRGRRGAGRRGGARGRRAHRFGDAQAGAAGLRRIRELASPDVVAALLRAVY